LTSDNNIINKIQKIDSSHIGNNKEYKGLYIFCSYDLVDATDFKISEPDKWPVIFNQFYEIVDREIKTKFSNINIWKYVGDEVLFFQKITCDIELYKFLPEFLNISDSIITSLKNLSSDNNIPLATKCTVWIAPVKKINPQNISSAKEEQKENLAYKNIVIQAAYTNTHSMIDFLGPDIDLGFRISKYSYKNVITISADLAYLLENMQTPSGQNKTELISCLRIIAYKQLKGIWKNRAYPIIWYYKDWENISSIFDYDAHCDSDLINNISLKKIEGISKLDTIFTQLKKGEEKKNLLKILNESCSEESTPANKLISVSRAKLAEVHCVAIVFNDEKQILVGKRPEIKKRLKGLWEFGCGQLKYGIGFKDCLINAYKEDFSIDIEVFSEYPISSYEIMDDEEESVTLVLFLSQKQ